MGRLRIVAADGAEKACNICGETKPIDEFKVLYARQDNGHIYRRNECNACRKLVRKRPDQLEKDRLRKEKYAAGPRARPPKRAYHLKKTYGITVEAADLMLAAQFGRCANRGCGIPISFEHPLEHRKNMAVIDHCHSTGAVRGIVCDSCNKSMGMAGDDPVKLLGLVEYLNKGTI